MPDPQLRQVPIKNYIKLGIILLISILLLFYFYLWYKTYEQNQLNTPIMDKYLQVINYNELEDYLLDNKTATIYVSKLQDKTIRNFEKQFKRLTIDNSLKDKILYLDLTEELKNNQISNTIKSKYNLTSSELPIILHFQDNSLKDTFSIKDQNYNLQTIEQYLYQNKIITIN